MTDSNTNLCKKELSSLKKRGKNLCKKELSCLKESINNKYVDKFRKLVNESQRNIIYGDENSENNELDTAFDASINPYKILDIIQAKIELNENLRF